MINRYYVEQACRDIRSGVIYPDRWPAEEEQVVEEEELVSVQLRWWEQEGLALEQALERGSRYE